MANDFKRMWTQEELKNTYYIKQQPEFETIYNITEEDFKKITSKNIVCFIDAVNDKSYFYKITSYGENEHNYYFNTGSQLHILKVIYEDGNYFYYVRQEEILTPAEFENLVREVPTDVSIIEDQGKLELMLEHDGNVLAINDTPNQFLQRRLDKPSKVITGQDLESLEDNLLPYVNTGTIIKLHETEDYISDNTHNTYCVVDRIESEYGDSYIRLTPFGNYSFTDNLLLYVDVNYLENTFVAHYINFSNGSYNNRTIPNNYLSVSLY